MSKSLRNYPDVSEVFDRDGSDAMRWFLMSSTILRGGNLVVTEQGIREGVRQVLLPLAQGPRRLWARLSCQAGQLGETRVMAPQGGVLRALYVAEGALVERGTPLAKVSRETLLSDGLIADEQVIEGLRQEEATLRDRLAALAGAAPLDADVIERARKPWLEEYGNALKDLGGWLALSARAQSEPDRIDRFLAAPAIMRAITPEDIHQAALKYLTPDGAVAFVVLPEAASKQ
jgi:hypothetical protein